MMISTDYIIVGDGYAAMFFAHQLIRNGKSFLLFSNGQKSASQVSAGIINPVVLKKFTTFWKAQEQIDTLRRTLSEMERYTGKNYLIDKNIHRVFHDEKERDLWLRKSKTKELRSFLSKEFQSLDFYANPYQSGRVLQSARLNVSDFFADMFHFLKENHHLVQENFDYQELNPEKKTYRQIYYCKIVFCEGMGVVYNPYFKNIPVKPNKGHHLSVKLNDNIVFSATIKKKHFLFPLNNCCHYYGGTYDREQLHHEIDNSAVEQLKNGLSEFYKGGFKVDSVSFGFRPTVADRRPIVGSHQKYDDLYVFNGLGARGILNGCAFSEKLYNHIELGESLPSEIDINRFNID